MVTMFKPLTCSSAVRSLGNRPIVLSSTGHREYPSKLCVAHHHTHVPYKFSEKNTKMTCYQQSASNLGHLVPRMPDRRRQLRDSQLINLCLNHVNSPKSETNGNYRRQSANSPLIPYGNTGRRSPHRSRVVAWVFTVK